MLTTLQFTLAVPISVCGFNVIIYYVISLFRGFWFGQQITATLIPSSKLHDLLIHCIQLFLLVLQDSLLGEKMGKELAPLCFRGSSRVCEFGREEDTLERETSAVLSLAEDSA